MRLLRLLRLLRLPGRFSPLPGRSGVSPVAVLVVALVMALPAAAQSPAPPPDWLRGSALDRQLAQPFGLTGPDRPLRDLIATIQTVQPVAIWIDPRIDPRQTARPPRQPVPLPAFLDAALAESQQQPVPHAVRLGDTLTIAPDDRIVSLARLRDHQRDAAGGEFATASVERRDLTWDTLIEPPELLDRITTDWSITIDPPAELRHDVWAAGTWLSVSDTEALAAVLVPMEHGFEWAGPGRIRLTPLAPRYEYPRQYASRKTVDELFPGRRRGRTLLATDAEHRQLAAAIRPPKAAPAGQRQLTLTIQKKPIGAVLAFLEANELPIVFTADSLDQVDRTRRIDLTVEQASLAELAAAIAKATGLVVESVGE